MSAVRGKIRQAKIGAKRKALESFETQVREDTTISDETKQEIFAGTKLTGKRLGSGGFAKDLAAAQATLEEAQLGQDPKFIARQQRKTRKRLIADQPGRAQTILTR